MQLEKNTKNNTASNSHADELLLTFSICEFRSGERICTFLENQFKAKICKRGSALEYLGIKGYFEIILRGSKRLRVSSQLA